MGVIAGAVMGGTVGILLFTAAVYLIHRHLAGHRSQPHPSFLVDEGTDPGDEEPFAQVPYPTPAAQGAAVINNNDSHNRKGKSHTAAQLGHDQPRERSAPPQLGLAWRNSNPENVANRQPSRPKNRARGGALADALPNMAAPHLNHTESPLVATAVAASHPVQRRAVHEEDAEDVDVLPPMYREAWAERHRMQLQEGAAAVARAEAGNHVVDEAPRHIETTRKQ